MALKIMDRIKHAWNAFADEEERKNFFPDIGVAHGVRPDRTRLLVSNERTIIASIYNRIGIDVAAVGMRHVRVDDDDNYIETIRSGLHDCLTVKANVDQGASMFRQDIAMTLLDKGVAAIVPVDTTLNPRVTGGYDIRSMRVGEITQWYPRHVKVLLYDDDPLKGGVNREVLLPKETVAIVENPLYTVMNEPNSTLQRLRRKLSLLDAVDEQSSSGKLDLLIQLPYVIKSQLRKDQAELRRKEIEVQLRDSQYGIAYIDGTERVTQLNRPAENNLLGQVEYLTKMLYGQLGITEEVLNGTADPQTMLNYYTRTVEPILRAITEAMIMTFLTSTARSQKQSIMFFSDPFRLLPAKDIAEVADKFTRNAIMTSNEFRPKLGLRQSKDPEADKLSNKNMPAADQAAPAKQPSTEKEGELQNGIRLQRLRDQE